MLSSIHDQRNYPILYIASKEAGLLVYNINNPESPSQIANLAITALDNLHVMNIEQQGDYLYLSLGNTFTNPQQGGFAVVDVTDVNNPTITDFYTIPNSTSGVGIVKVEGDFAYVGAMKEGLYVFDVSDKYNIQFLSSFLPDIQFPPVFNPNPDLYNLRGMQVKNDTVYACFDAGGIRIIDYSNKQNAIQIGAWCNPELYTPVNLPRAYNNCVLLDSILYVTVDYCGVEAISVTDPTSPTLLSWWNPYNCPSNNWFTSPSHTNEISVNSTCEKLFVSTGKSDLIVLDISNPNTIDSCNYFGGVNNAVGSWGVSIWENYVYLTTICALIPFSSTESYLSILDYTTCTNHTTNTFQFPFEIAVNTSKLSIKSEINQPCHYSITATNGQLIEQGELLESKEINTSGFSEGSYFFQLRNNDQNFTKLIQIIH